MSSSRDLKLHLEARRLIAKFCNCFGLLLNDSHAMKSVFPGAKASCAMAAGYCIGA